MAIMSEEHSYFLSLSLIYSSDVSKLPHLLQDQSTLPSPSSNLAGLFFSLQI